METNETTQDKELHKAIREIAINMGLSNEREIALKEIISQEKNGERQSQINLEKKAGFREIIMKDNVPVSMVVREPFGKEIKIYEKTSDGKWASTPSDTFKYLGFVGFDEAISNIYSSLQ